MGNAFCSKRRYGIGRNSFFFTSDLFIRISICYVFTIIIIFLVERDKHVHHHNSARAYNDTGVHLNCTTTLDFPQYFTPSLWVATLLYLSLVLFLSAFLFYLQCSIWTGSKICMKTSSCIARERDFYFDESRLKVKRPKKSSQVLAQEFGIGDPNAVSVTCRQVKCRLEDFAFTRKLNTKYALYIDVILWLHDLIKTVKYLHENDIYHLNLSLGNVYLHWFEDLTTSDKYRSFTTAERSNNIWKLYSCLRKSSVEKERNDPEARIVLADLENAVKSTSGRVSASACDDMPARCRPPECTDSEEVDAAKVDAWCIGVIAYELFTGGMLHVALVKNTPDVPLHEILNAGLLKEYFNTALWTFFQFPEALMWQRMKCNPTKYYSLDSSELTNDCWEFVMGLLDPNPNYRMELKAALECSLMQKVSRDLNDKYFVNCPFIM